jgi:energy-converting hydrogenase B subunit D
VIEACLRWGAIALVAVIGPAVALTRDPRAQAITLTLYGLALTLLFLVFQAPDVALAQATVGAVALPLMVLLTLARMRRINRERQDSEDEP